MAMTMTRGEWRWAALALLLLAAVAAAGTREGGRRPRLLGGLEDANENDEGVQRALQFAMSEYNKASNDKYSSRVARVVRAQKQVGAPSPPRSPETGLAAPKPQAGPPPCTPGPASCLEGASPRPPLAVAAGTHRSAPGEEEGPAPASGWGSGPCLAARPTAGSPPPAPQPPAGPWARLLTV